jgi:hypothetical protein
MVYNSRINHGSGENLVVVEEVNKSGASLGSVRVTERDLTPQCGLTPSLVDLLYIILPDSNL